MNAPYHVKWFAKYTKEAHKSALSSSEQTIQKHLNWCCSSQLTQKTNNILETVTFLIKHSPQSINCEQGDSEVIVPLKV